WRLRYNDVESQFNANTTKARIQNRDADLAANFLLVSGRGLVSLSSLATVLPQILGGPVTYHENSRRLYIGSVGVHFTAQIGDGNPPALVMSFTSPVNPRIATEPGKVQMLFTREPLMAPSAATLTFDSKSIPSATYQENNGAAEIVVNTRVPLFASFSDNGRTITLSQAAQTKNEAGASAAPSFTAPSAAITPETQPPSTVTPPIVKPSVFAIVDASHGGEESGAMLSAQISEKDVTLAFARRLKQQLDAKGLTSMVLRDGDNALTVDQRADLVNQAHPRIYICIHASSMGKGARIYTGLLPPANGDSSGLFLNWNTAQAGFLTLSQAVATGLTQELQNEHLSARQLAAPIRPLNSITSAAIAVEIAPNGDVTSLESADYQTSIANGIATFIVNMRARLESGQ
ncbi:MAG TPA: N-acetylmuramoyl-L-alanine amidase, partial [Terriglobales bacterium]|nr:N-acetylmuramoyl-L-alanine amidase [Terriglobales bacterium]